MNNTIPSWLRKYLDERLQELYATRTLIGNNTDVKARIDEIDKIFAQEEY